VLPGGRSKIKIAGGILKLGDPVWVRDDDKSSPDVYLRTILTSITDAGDKCTLTGPAKTHPDILSSLGPLPL